jgi:hypothetical protein
MRNIAILLLGTVWMGILVAGDDGKQDSKLPKDCFSSYEKAKEQAKKEKKPIVWIESSPDVNTVAFLNLVLSPNAELLTKYVCCVEKVELGKEPEDVKSALLSQKNFLSQFPIVIIFSSEGKPLSVATEPTKYLKVAPHSDKPFSDNGQFKKDLAKYADNK